MIVRPREAGDLPTLLTALREVHERDGYPVTWKADPAAWLTPPGLQGAWVADRAGRPAGHAALAAVHPDDPAAPAWSRSAGQPAAQLACLTRVFVAVGDRGAGLGAALVDAAAEHARRERRTTVLEVSPADRAALALYRRLGWREAGAGPARWWVPAGGTSVLLVAPP